jgi:hypothetical protein
VCIKTRKINLVNAGSRQRRAKDTVRSWNEGERLVQEIYVTGG